MGSVEVLDIVDEHDQVVGQAPRGEVYTSRLRHRCVFVLVHDERDRVFVHRRPANKAVFASRYDMFVGGAVAAGEPYEDAARREAAEELGVREQLAKPVPVLKFLHDTNEHTWWCAVYSLRYNGPVKPPADEVSWHSFLTSPELNQQLDKWLWAPDSLEAYVRLRQAVADYGHPFASSQLARWEGA